MAHVTRRRVLTGLGATVAAVLAPPMRQRVRRRPKARPPPAVARPRPQRLRASPPAPRRPRPPLRQRRGRHLPRRRRTPHRPFGGPARPHPHAGVALPRPARRPRESQPRIGVPGVPAAPPLLIDIKTEGSSTYLELDRQLVRHKGLFTTFAHGRVHPGAVTAVISGDRAARTPMEAQTVRRAFYDGRLADLGTSESSFASLISDNWTLNFTWPGVGAFPEAERQKLRSIVGAAHARGQQVRFWATPDLAGPARDALWAELLAARRRLPQHGRPGGPGGVPRRPPDGVAALA